MTAAILPDSLQEFAINLLQQAGFTSSQAHEMAELLVWADTRGVGSHGVMRIPRYVEMLQTGEVSAQAELQQVQGKGAVRVLEANKAPGASAMNEAVRVAAQLAEEHGIAWCGVRQMSHAGAIGYFVEQLSRQGKIGIVMTASKPLMGYFGAKGEVLSSNPLAIGVPMPDGQPPIILDMSTASVALGKLMAARQANREIPPGWGVDAEGADTTDPHKVAALLPMAGPKGSGLSLMIEVLCSVLAGNPNIALALAGEQPRGFNGLVLAVDPAAFGDPEVFLANVRALANAIHALDPAPGVESVLLPGERGYVMSLERGQHGIPLAPATTKALLALAAKLGVEIPAVLA